MIATPHMLVGAAGALKARTPAGGLAIGALTHLLLDAVPHRDYRLGALGGLALIADLAAGTISVGLLSGGSEVVLAGALGGVLPDAVRLAERALGVSPTGWAHNTIHTPSRPSAWRSAATQGFAAAIGALVLHAAPGRERPPAP
ncbi:MAG: hypothetical protein ACYCX7_03570 [Solirubrobacteraceae bacterium]